MRYSIWRVSPGEEPFALTTVGATRDRQRALAKAESYNERLKLSDPQSPDRFVARDEKGRELKSAS
jgi:hypothetical protein